MTNGIKLRKRKEACPMQGKNKVCRYLSGGQSGNRSLFWPALKETKDDIATLGQQLQQGSAGNAVNEIIYNLRQKYPNATSEEVVNYLVTAYCPVVKEDKALSEDQARAKLDEFAMQVRKIYEN